MTITDRANTHFTNLANDAVLAKNYFFNESINDYNVEKLFRLQKEVNLAVQKNKSSYNLFSLATLSRCDRLIKKTALKLEKEHKNLSIAKKALEVFESNLAYLIISGNVVSLSELGFTNDYIKDLLNRKKDECNNSTVEYNYNEATGRTSQSINGHFVVLPYTPSIVASKVRQKKLEEKIHELIVK